MPQQRISLVENSSSSSSTSSDMLPRKRSVIITIPGSESGGLTHKADLYCRVPTRRPRAYAQGAYVDRRKKERRTWKAGHGGHGASIKSAAN